MANNPFKTLIETNKLTGPNFEVWLRNLKIILSSERRQYVLDIPVQDEPEEDSSDDEKFQYQPWKEDDMQVRCLMLASMSNELQRQHETIENAASILLHLQEMYGTRTRRERYVLSKEIFKARMTENSDVSAHVLKMIGLIEKLTGLGVALDNELSVDLVLQSLPNSYDQFVVNFNMNQFETKLPELLNMLKTAESTIKKDKPVLLMNSSSKAKKGNKKKNKTKNLKGNGGVKKGKKSKSKKSDECFKCGNVGHWKRNCKEPPAQGMFFVEVNFTVNNSSWVLDTGCGVHICNDLQVMKRTKELSREGMTLRMGDGALVAAKAVEMIYLELEDRKLVLHSVYFVSEIIRNIISIPVLDREGYCFEIRNKSLLLFYESSLIMESKMKDGMYSISPIISNLNIQQSNKCKQDNQVNAQMWHKRLGHISKERIRTMAKHLGVNDLDELSSCESCLKGKMTKLPFSGKAERATKPLDLVHTDVCGPMSVSTHGG